MFRINFEPRVSREELEKALRLLTEAQATVLYWTCRGLNRIQISEKIYKSTGIVPSPGTVAREMGFVYDRLRPILGITENTHPKDRKKIFEKHDICGILFSLIKGDPKYLSRFPMKETMADESFKELQRIAKRKAIEEILHFKSDKATDEIHPVNKSYKFPEDMDL